MKTSIVIRTLNNEATIGRVLDGVRQQALSGYETIIVDSGSSDGTLEIVRRHPHVLVDYSRERFTYGGSLNAGCAVAQGEYLVCLSSHCVPLHRDWLRRLIEVMDADPHIAGAWGPVMFDIEGHAAGEDDGVETRDLQSFYERPNWGLQNPNSIIRRKLWKERPFSVELERCEDQEWAHHFLQQGYTTARVRGAETGYLITHGAYAFGTKTMRDFIVLNELFDYQPKVSTTQLGRNSGRLLLAATLGKKSARVSVLLIASMVGRFAADKVIRYRKLSARWGDRRLRAPVALSNLLASRAGLELRRARQFAAARRADTRSRGPSAPTGMEGMTRFFLVGEMRSGTSWLARALDTNPDVFCKGEGSFFGRDQTEEEIPVYKEPTPSLYNALATSCGLRTWHSFSWNAWGKGDVEEDLRNLTRLSIDYFLARDAAASGKRIVGDKSPLHTDHVDEIFRFYPEAKVIHIFRDGRDVAVSLMHHFWRLSKDRGGIFELEPEEIVRRDTYLADPVEFVEAGNSIFTEERLRQMAVRWARRVDKAARDGTELFGDSFAQLRFEDLLTSPEAYLKTLFELLGARSDEATVRRCVERSSFERLAKRPRGQEDPASFFRKGVSGDWRGVLTERDRELYEELAGPTLLRMGYSVG